MIPTNSPIAVRAHIFSTLNADVNRLVGFAPDPTLEVWRNECPLACPVPSLAPRMGIAGACLSTIVPVRIGFSTNSASTTTAKFARAAAKNTPCQLPVASFSTFDSGTKKADVPLAV